jgi:hypothetical protein
MKTEQKILIGFGVLAVAFAAYWEASSGFFKRKTEITPELLTKGAELPPLWVFYNNSQVNSRQWNDFGARSSRVLNIPILNLFYQSIVAANGNDYRVEVIGGLQGVASLLGVEVMPKRLQNLRANVGTAEEDWIRTAVLAKFGGLWLSPSVICVKGFGELPKDKLIVFGQDDVPMYGTSVPGFRAMWAPAPGNEYLVAWEERCRERLNSKVGGLQVRGDAKSDWFDLCHGKEGVEFRPYDELSRNSKTQKKLQLEDIFATWMHGDLPFEIPDCAKYIVVPYNDMTVRTAFGWILASSEEQILESELVVSSILKRVLV